MKPALLSAFAAAVLLSGCTTSGFDSVGASLSRVGSRVGNGLGGLLGGEAPAPRGTPLTGPALQEAVAAVTGALPATAETVDGRSLVAAACAASGATAPLRIRPARAGQEVTVRFRVVDAGADGAMALLAEAQATMLDDEARTLAAVRQQPAAAADGAAKITPGAVARCDGTVVQLSPDPRGKSFAYVAEFVEAEAATTPRQIRGTLPMVGEGRAVAALRGPAGTRYLILEALRPKAAP